MTKAELRKTYKSKRKSLTKEEVVAFSQQITNKVKELNIWDKSCYHIFLPIEPQKEINTNELIGFLHQLQKRVVIPKIYAQENQLISCRFLPTTELVTNKWGILEPEFCRAVDVNKIEVVFIPLLISDQEGNRVGYGKGFYDEFLSNCNEETIKVGLNFFEPINKISDVYAKDIPLDYLVTPQNIYSY